MSEVTLNNGYLQEQMAIRDEAMNSMSEQIQHLQVSAKSFHVIEFVVDNIFNALPSSSSMKIKGTNLVSL